MLRSESAIKWRAVAEGEPAMTATSNATDTDAFVQSEEYQAFVHRQIRELVRSAPLGCLTDRVFFLRRWLTPVVAHFRNGADKPENLTVESHDGAVKTLAEIQYDLVARGFRVPAMASFEVDPLGALYDWHDYLGKLAPHLTGADQLALDSLISTVAEKH